VLECISAIASHYHPSWAWRQAYGCRGAAWLCERRWLCIPVRSSIAIQGQLIPLKLYEALPDVISLQLNAPVIMVRP
jgi:hypothetical protein